MTQRLFFLIIGLLIGLSTVVFVSNQDFKASAQESIALAVLYYKQQAQHYYLQFTGQLPPPSIENNKEEWRDFEMLCDALMLKRRESLDWFERYIDSRADVIKDIKKKAAEETKKTKKNKTDKSAGNTKIAQKKLSAKEMFENWRKEFLMVRRLTVVSFVDRMKQDISPMEAKVIGEILMQQFIIPDANLRVLRRSNLSGKQRELLQPAAYRLVRSSIAYSPQFPGDGYHEDEKENLERAGREFLELAEQNLSSKQMNQWRDCLPQGNEAVAAFRKRMDGIKEEMKALQEREKNQKAVPPNELSQQQPVEENLIEAQG